MDFLYSSGADHLKGGTVSERDGMSRGKSGGFHEYDEGDHFASDCKSRDAYVVVMCGVVLQYLARCQFT